MDRRQERDAEEQAEHHRRLPPLGRLLGESLSELNLLRILPELASHLRAIRHATESMSSEVRGMHSAVRRVEHQVVELRGQVERLDDRLVELEGRMGRLEPHIADVNLAIRPLRRARRRFPHRAPTVADEVAAAEDEGLAPAPEPPLAPPGL